MNKLLVKISILSISLLTVMASAAISPALAKIKQAFPQADITLIKLVLTLPSLLIIPFSLLGGWLAGRISKRLILAVGLVIYFFGGVGGGLARSIGQLLFIRGLFGVGVGLIIPLSISLIADFYEKEERAKMMGLSGSVSHFGGVIFLLLSGWLAMMSWRYAFAVYALSALILGMVWFWLPEPQAAQTRRTAGAGSQKVQLGLPLYISALLGALMMVAFYAAPTNLAMFIEADRQMYTSTKPLFSDAQELMKHLESGRVSATTIASFKDNGIKLSADAKLSLVEPSRKWSITDGKKTYIVSRQQDRLVISSERLGRPGIAGMFLSTMTMIGVFSGIFLAFLLRRFGPYCTVIGLAAMAVGYALLAGAGSLAPVFIAMVCIGFSSGVLMPILLLRVARMTNEVTRALAMAVVSCGIYLGQFMSPVVLKAASMFPGQDVFRSQFNFLAFGLLIATGWSLFVAFKAARNGAFEQYAKAKVPGH